jgi:hypothetical protein
VGGRGALMGTPAGRAGRGCRMTRRRWSRLASAGAWLVASEQLPSIATESVAVGLLLGDSKSGAERLRSYLRLSLQTTSLALTNLFVNRVETESPQKGRPVSRKKNINPQQKTNNT